MRILAGAIAVLALVPASALADQPRTQPTITAAACVPTSDSVSRVQTSRRGVKFRAGVLGTIRLICQAPQVGTYSGFEAHLRDPDGAGTRANVTVDLMLSRPESPDGFSVAGLSSSLHSSPSTQYTSLWASTGTSLEVLHYDVMWYEVTLTRSAANLDVEILGITSNGTFR